MTDDDVRGIERELEIALPAEYRRVVLSFPIRAYAGNSSLQVWDNPGRIVELNRELRAGSSVVKAWPKSLFATGRGDDGCAIALDLADGNRLLWVDRCHVDAPGTHRMRDSFSDWAAAYFAGLRDDLIGDEIDPDGSPEDRIARSAPPGWERIGCFVLLAALVVAIVVRILG